MSENTNCVIRLKRLDFTHKNVQNNKLILMLHVFHFCSGVQHLDPWSRSWWFVHRGWRTQQGRDCFWRPQGWIQRCLLHCPGAWWGFCPVFSLFILMVGYKCLSWLLSIYFRRLWSIHQIQWWAHPWQSICGACGLTIWWFPPSHCCQSSGEASRKTDICPLKTTPKSTLGTAATITVKTLPHIKQIKLSFMSWYYHTYRKGQVNVILHHTCSHIHAHVW